MLDLLCKLLKIKAKLLIAYHLETDSQSKIANQEMERHLQTYANYFQDDWAQLLPMGEFATNINVSTTIKISLFLAMQNYNLRMSFNQNINLLTNSIRKKIANIMAKLIANCMEKI